MLKWLVVQHLKIQYTHRCTIALVRMQQRIWYVMQTYSPRHIIQMRARIIAFIQHRQFAITIQTIEMLLATKILCHRIRNSLLAVAMQQQRQQHRTQKPPSHSQK